VVIEASSSFGWHKYTGFDGDTVSIDRFGASAPGPLLLEKFGVVGLASAFSIAYAIFGVVALVVLQRRIGRILEPRTLRALIRQLLASAAMILVMALGNHLLRVNALTQLLLVGTAGVAVYVLCLIALRSEETQLVMARVRRR
jgi:peptidoglycan biosynthesis protein MviN/MurJ (putative lipid II flippase)